MSGTTRLGRLRGNVDWDASEVKDSGLEVETEQSVTRGRRGTAVLNTENAEVTEKSFVEMKGEC